MKNVGQATLTIRIPKKTLFDVFASHELPEHPDKAMGMPDFMVIAESLEPYPPIIFILDESIQILPICSHHIRSQSSSHKSSVIRIGNSLQYPFHLHCLAGIKDVFLHMEDTGNASFSKSVVNQQGLPVKADEGATYYIGGKNRTVVIRTDTDFGKASFIIDDADAQNRNAHVFLVSSSLQTFKPVGISSLKRNQEKLNVSLPSTCLITVTNSNVKRYIRFGANQNNGSS
jgi:hypothetical protein